MIQLELDREKDGKEQTKFKVREKTSPRFVIRQQLLIFDENRIQRPTEQYSVVF